MSRRVLSTPELVTEILSEIPDQELARYILVSPHFFRSLIPRIWKHVQWTSSQLLRRVSSVEFHKDSGYEMSPWHFTQARLQTYTQFTKKLTLRTSSQTQNDPESLIQYTFKHPLFPHLQQLFVHTSSHPGPDPELDWIPLLFCSTLLEIQTVPDPIQACPSMSIHTTRSWLEEIIAKCPNILKMAFYACSPWANHPLDAPEGALQTSWEIVENYHILIGLLAELRWLSTNLLLTEGLNLVVISRLPALETLEIRGPHQTHTSFHTGGLSDDSFLSLRHLSLHNLGWEDLDTISRAKCIAHKVTSLELVMGVKPNSSDEADAFETTDIWMHPRIAEGFAHLTKLIIRFDWCSETNPGVISRQDLENLRLLPLQYICVQRGCLDAENEDPCQLLANAWPNITELHWADQQAATPDLMHFASLPNLRHLTLNLSMTPVPLAVKAFRPSGGIALCILECSKETSATYFRSFDINAIASFLFELWPNISVISPQIFAQTCSEKMSSLNQAIILRREQMHFLK